MTENELQKVGEQVVKQKRPKRSEQLQVQTEPGDNKKYILHALELSELPEINIDDENEVKARIKDYFIICAEADMKPSVPGLALALGLDRRRLWEIREQKRGMGKNLAVVDAIKKAMKILDLQLNNYAQDGKMNPATAIFLMKNNFGYADEQKIVLEPSSPLGDEQKDPEELRQKYLSSTIVEDADE